MINKCLSPFIVFAFVFTSFIAYTQNDKQISELPCVSISIDSARKMVYNEETSPLEVVTMNILGVVDENPDLFLQHTDFPTYLSFLLGIDQDSLGGTVEQLLDTVSVLEFFSNNFDLLLHTNSERKSQYQITPKEINFSYLWIKTQAMNEAIIIVNNEYIYSLRRLYGFWKIYMWSSLNNFDDNYEPFKIVIKKQ